MKRQLTIVFIVIIGWNSEALTQDGANKKEGAKKDMKAKAEIQKGKYQKKSLTPEERDALNVKIKSKYRYVVDALNSSVAKMENRREELEELIEQEKTLVRPPQPGMFSNALKPSSNKAGFNAKNKIFQKMSLGNAQSREVPVTQEIKDAAKAIIEAMEAYIPLIHDQVDQMQTRMADLDNPPPSVKKISSTPSTSADDVAKAQVAVDRVEANLSFVLASAWLNSVGKSDNSIAKESAADSTRSLTRFLELKKQYDDLGAQLGAVSGQLDDGVSNIVGALYPRPVKTTKTTKNAPVNKKK
jgi:hypothetical protein